MNNKDKYGGITIALLIGILIIAVCSSISISTATMCIGTKSVLNTETLKTEINFLLESYANQFRATGKIIDIALFDENLNEVSNIDNVRYVIEHEIINDKTCEILNLAFKDIDNNEIIDNRIIRRYVQNE